MKRHGEEAKLIAEAFDILAEACYNIQTYEQCEECPMRYMCLNDTDESVMTMADLKGPSSWREFLEYSYKADFSKAEKDAQYAEFMREYIKEEGIIDENY